MTSLLRKIRRLLKPSVRVEASAVPGIDAGQLHRVNLTASCRDCEAIPKVRRAGECFTEKGQRLQRMHNGINVVEHGYCGHWMTELIRRLRGHHEPQEEFAFHEVLKHVRPGGTIVELGCWWSFYALWFLEQNPTGRAVLIEPDSVHLDLGQQNFAINNRVGEFVHASVGRSAKPPRLFTCESPDAVPMVPEVSLDHLVDAKKIDRVEVLLADVQGAELDTLHGALSTIQRGRLRFAFVSTHHHCISGDPLIHHRCLEFIRNHGGHVLAEHTVMESYSGDGLIVASFDPADRALPAIPISHNPDSRNNIFRPLEHDLAEAWDAIAATGEMLEILATKYPDVQAAVNRLQEHYALLNRKWPTESSSKAA